MTMGGAPNYRQTIHEHLGHDIIAPAFAVVSPLLADDDVKSAAVHFSDDDKRSPSHGCGSFISVQSLRSSAIADDLHASTGRIVADDNRQRQGSNAIFRARHAGYLDQEEGNDLVIDDSCQEHDYRTAAFTCDFHEERNSNDSASGGRSIGVTSSCSSGGHRLRSGNRKVRSVVCLNRRRFRGNTSRMWRSCAAMLLGVCRSKVQHSERN